MGERSLHTREVGGSKPPAPIGGNSAEVERVVEDAIERLATNRRAAALDEDDLRSPDTDVVLLHNIRADIRLASRAAELMLLALLGLRAAHVVMWDEAVAERDRLEAAEQSSGLSLDLELHIRELYELFYAIYGLVERTSDGAPAPPAEVLDELARLEHFRSRLIVHKERVVRPMRGNSGGRYETLDVRIGGSLKAIGEEDAAQLRAIFDRNAANLPPDVQNERNTNQQLQILYEHLGSVTREDLSDVKALIGRNGVRSDLPIVLARVVLKLAEIYFPSLAR